MRIALLSTPWPLFNRPSIQLGVLKAFVEKNVPALRVDCFHLYLAVAEALGYKLYQEISEKTWLSECGYAALLFPGQREPASRLWPRHSRKLPACGQRDFGEFLQILADVSTRIIEETEWSRYRLVGFSVCFGQLTSSLYFARRIKMRNPGLRVVLGGSQCSGSLGISLLNAFPLIDYVVSGEGEIPLTHLVRGLAQADGPDPPKPVAGLFTRGPHPFHDPEAHSQVPKLEELPFPDYTDYFEQLEKLPSDKRFFPKIPLESSRGCWWGGSPAAPGREGCAFCNLNLQWEGYRAKSSRQFLAEVERLTKQYRLLSISLVDNLIPPADGQGLWEPLALLGRDLRIFAEIRAPVRHDHLLAMKAGGLVELQAGIEALSSRLLRKLHKGTTVIENLELMKHCEAPATPRLRGNLILQFPGSDEEDVQETLWNLEFAFPFRPLTPVVFWLGRGSPVWRHPDRYGLKQVANHPAYGRIFPPEILTRLDLMIQGYRENGPRQRRLWRPVGRAVKAWQAAYAKRHREGKQPPLLGYGDGGDFLIITQHRLDGQVLTHRLTGHSRAIYLYCEVNRALTSIQDRFPELPQEQLRSFLRIMVEKRLMFAEGERYLSLAVPLKGYSQSAGRGQGKPF